MGSLRPYLNTAAVRVLQAWSLLHWLCSQLSYHQQYADDRQLYKSTSSQDLTSSVNIEDRGDTTSSDSAAVEMGLLFVPILLRKLSTVRGRQMHLKYIKFNFVTVIFCILQNVLLLILLLNLLNK